METIKTPRKSKTGKGTGKGTGGTPRGKTIKHY